MPFFLQGLLFFLYTFPFCKYTLHVCYVFNVNLTDSFDDRRLDQLVYSPNYYIQIFQTQLFARSED